MLDMTNKLVALLCVTLLVGSLFFALGDVSSSESSVLDDDKIVLVETENERSKNRLKDLDVQVMDSYGTYNLVKIGSKKIDSLREDGFTVNELPSRTEISVKGHTFDIFDSKPDIPDELKIDGYEKGGEGLYIVHMLGPINPEWRGALEEEGVDVLNYVPNYAYEVKMTPKEAKRARSLDFVDWIDFYHPGYKLEEGVRKGKLSVELVSNPSKDSIRSLKKINPEFSLLNEKTGSRAVMEVRSQQQIEELAKTKDVYHISNIDERELKMEVDSQIIGGGSWIMDDDNDPGTAFRSYGDHGAYINQLGYTGKNVTVAIADTGLGDGTVGDAGHPDFDGRVVGGYTWQTSGWEDDNGHGTHAAGSIAGDSYSGTGVQYAGLDGNYYASQGLAYDSGLYSLRIFDGGGNWAGPNEYYEIVEAAAQNSDSYVHSNSWGEETGDGKYEPSDHDYDMAVRDADSSASGNQPMIITVSAGNNGDSSQTISSPGNGKNVITVGATESYVPDGGSYGYIDFNNPDYISGYSSRGWTEDNRVKPDVTAPGTGILSTSSPLNNPTDPYTEDDRYEWMSGTSMANPDVAGAASAVVEWYEENYGERPSPAMVKSLLINTAHDLNNSNGNTGSIPNPKEGWGMVDLSKLEYPKDDPVPFILKDQNTTLQTGEQKTYKLLREREGEPLKLTLHWSDEEGSGLINDLKLKVTSPSGKVYKGNAFTNGWSQSGQDAISDFDDSGDGWDDTNNVRNVYLAPDEVESGVYTVEVEGFDVTEDSNNDGKLNQDYAFVAYNSDGGFIKSPDEGEAFNTSDVTVEWFTETGFSYNVSLDDGTWIDVGTNDSHTFQGLTEGWHKVEVKAKNSTTEKIDNVEFLIDKQSPTVDIVSPEEGETVGGSNTTVEWTGSDDQSAIDHYETRIDQGGWKNTGTYENYTFEGLERGDHTVDTKAVDEAGNSFIDTVNFTLDTDPPDLDITAPLHGEIFNTDSVTAEWECSSEDLDHYEVDLNGELKYSGTDNNFTFVNLEDGRHRADVRAIDTAGNVNNESVNFTVDTEIPDLNITGIEEGQIFNKREVTVSWNGSDSTSGIIYYEVRLNDNVWEYAGLDTEKTYSELSGGFHTVEVKAIDGAENNVTASVTFAVDISSPVVEINNIDEGQILDNNNVSVKWSGYDEVSGINEYRVRINGGEWIKENEESFTFEELSDQRHFVEVEAEDMVGLTSTASVNFTVDTTAPELDITHPEDDSLIGEDLIKLEWSGKDSLSGMDHYEIRLEDEDWKDVGNVKKYEVSDLADGEWRVHVKAVDKAGNTKTDDIAFTIDDTNPKLDILNPDDTATLKTNSLNVTWEGQDGGSGIVYYEVRINSGEWINVGRKEYHEFADLPYGKNKIEVRTIDRAGNIESSEITVDLEKSSNRIPGFTTPVIVIGGLTLLTLYLGKPWLLDSKNKRKN